jgi:hypothetical protein
LRDSAGIAPDFLARSVDGASIRPHGEREEPGVRPRDAVGIVEYARVGNEDRWTIVQRRTSGDR